MNGERYSTPPTAEKLEESTTRLRASNDRLEASAAGVPALTNEQRLAVAGELWALARSTGASDGFRLVLEYERRVKEGIPF